MYSFLNMHFMPEFYVHIALIFVLDKPRQTMKEKTFFLYQELFVSGFLSGSYFHVPYKGSRSEAQGTVGENGSSTKWV